MRAYIIGTGSAGCRHSRILHSLGIDVIGVSETKSLLGQLRYPHDFDQLISLNDCSPLDTDLIVISSISSKHTNLCAHFSSHPFLFCEKPGPDLDSENIQILFNLRFLDVVEYFIETKKDILGLELNFQANAMKWHPDEDYRKSYVFNKRLGGGCILTNSHEIDLMHAFDHQINLQKFIVDEMYEDENDELIDVAYSYEDNGYILDSSIVSKSPYRIYTFHTTHNSFKYDFSSTQFIKGSLNSIELSYYKMWSSILKNIKHNKSFGNRLPSAREGQHIHAIRRVIQNAG